MNDTASHISLIAAALYAGLALLTARTALFASQRQLPLRDRQNWWAMSALFLCMIVMRSLALEHRISDFFRAWAHLDGVYDQRRELQKPLVAIILVGAAAVAFLAVRLNARAKHPAAKMIFLSRFAAGILLVLIVMRMISLHAVDALLYGWGPVRLNYLLDIGSSLAIGGAAWRYRQLLEAETGARRKGGKRRSRD